MPPDEIALGVVRELRTALDRPKPSIPELRSAHKKLRNTMSELAVHVSPNVFNQMVAASRAFYAHIGSHFIDREEED